MKRALAPVGVFVILIASYAFFWHARDWNISSRLMLTYALADRGTVQINGLEDHTRDRARVGDRYYSDKLPGYSLLAIPSYAVGKLLFKLPAHPLDQKGEGFTHWWPDYWITLGTSGVLSALCGALLVIVSRRVGCSDRLAAIVGLIYGLATPAYVYATLSYGHQATAFLLLAGYVTIDAIESTIRPMMASALAGFLVASGPLVELQVAPSALVLVAYFLFVLMKKRLVKRCFAGFAIGCLVPAIALIAYNLIAFGSPWDMGYFHEDLQQFQDVHSSQNPLGMRSPSWSRIGDLLWNEHRGLIWFAPVVVLSPIGWVLLAIQRRWSLCWVSLLVSCSVLLVNLSYPEWTGGWSTGPRLLVPLLPFAMIPIAAMLAAKPRIATPAVTALALAGFIAMTLFQGVGGRIPPAPENVAIDSPYAHPLRQVVWPMWRGDPLPPWKERVRFDRNLVSKAWGKSIDDLAPGRRWMQFLPLIVGQILSISLLVTVLGSKIKIHDR